MKYFLLLMLISTTITAQERTIFYPYKYDKVGVGMQKYDGNGYIWYKLSRNSWVRFPSANAKPIKYIPIPIFKGKYTPLKTKHKK